MPANRLKRNLELPPFGYGVRHYTQLEPDQVKKVFKKVPRKLRAGKVLIADKATELVKQRKLVRRTIKGCYWQIILKNEDKQHAKTKVT